MHIRMLCGTAASWGPLIMPETGWRRSLLKCIGNLHPARGQTGDAVVGVALSVRVPYLAPWQRLCQRRHMSKPASHPGSTATSAPASCMLQCSAVHYMRCSSAYAGFSWSLKKRMLAACCYGVRTELTAAGVTWSIPHTNPASPKPVCGAIVGMPREYLGSGAMHKAR